MPDKLFSIPGYIRQFPLVKLLYEYKQQYPEQFIADHVMDNVYDFPPYLMWNGGREAQNIINTTPIQDIMQWINTTPMQIRHVCTNLLLDEHDVLDPDCNNFLHTYMRPHDAVTLFSPILKQYLEREYPQLDIIYSTTLNITDIDKVNELTKNNIYVMNYNCNNDDEYIKQLKHLNNIEVVCAEPCRSHCPERSKHYLQLSKIYKNLPLTEEEQVLHCDSAGSSPSADECVAGIFARKHMVTLNRVQELSDKGIRYFKISGRTNTPEVWLRIVCYYLVKPEFYEMVWNKLYRIYLKQSLIEEMKSRHR